MIVFFAVAVISAIFDTDSYLDHFGLAQAPHLSVAGPFRPPKPAGSEPHAAATRGGVSGRASSGPGTAWAFWGFPAYRGQYG